MHRYIIVDDKGNVRGGVERSASFGRLFEIKNPGWVARRA